MASSNAKSHSAAPGQLRRVGRALKFAVPYRTTILAIFLITLLLAAINASEPLILKYLFDLLASKDSRHLLSVAIGLLIALPMIREIAGAFSNRRTWQVRLSIHQYLMDKAVERLHRMPFSLRRSEGVGAILTKLERSIQGFLTAISEILFSVVPAVLYLCLAITVMLRLNWTLALVVIAFVPVPALLAARAAPEQMRRERTLLDQWTKIYSRLNEVLAGLPTVRSFGMEDAERRRFLDHVSTANQVVIRGVRRDTSVGLLTNLVVSLAFVAALTVGATFVLQGRTTLGTLIAFLGYIGGLFGPVQGLTTVYQTLQRACVSLDEVFAILDIQEHIRDAPNAQTLARVKGDFIFENVSFRYEDLSEPVLQGIDLEVSAGQTLAIVGPSGSGKSTMMALVMRFYDPRQGAILLDGRDLRTLKQESLRRKIGTVLQDPVLFNDTLRNNIAYGCPEASLNEIQDAARAAGAHEFISRLPEGYDTLIGERGGRLSAGERQRVAIARALLKDPPILVLDEATSALDAESEALVQDALARLMKGRTAFVIAHRLATVVHADRIIVLKAGRIIESGSHEDLMRSSSYYASLVDRQTRGLIRNSGEALLETSDAT